MRSNGTNLEDWSDSDNPKANLKFATHLYNYAINMEFKELLGLKKAVPIISFGDGVKYIDLELPEEGQINPEQLKMYDMKQTEPVAAAKEKPKKVLTKAEQRRERQAERARERQERRERYQREREEEERRRQEEDSDDEEDEAPAQPQGMLQRLLNAVFVQPAAAAADINAPEVQRDFAALNPGVRRAKLWDIISRFQWHNASDGVIQRNVVDAVLRPLSAIDVLTFKTEYENMFNGAINFLNVDGMFDRNGAATHDDRAKIVSHIIALGEDQYTTLIDDPAILQFLIETEECQSLNVLLPENIRI